MRSIPFFSNTSDDTHCYQAALKMIIGSFWPSENYSFSELDKITQKVDGLWTWPTAGLLWLQEKGAEIKIVESFDYEEFIKKGAQYLLEFFGEEVGTEQIKFSDVAQEISLAQKALKSLSIHKHIPSIEELKNLLNENYFLICNINSKTLNNQSGYVGHFVVLIGHDNDHLFLHDPGLPPLENREVTFDQFEKAWAYPDEKTKNYIAIKYQTP